MNLERAKDSAKEGGEGQAEGPGYSGKGVNQGEASFHNLSFYGTNTPVWRPEITQFRFHMLLQVRVLRSGCHQSCIPREHVSWPFGTPVSHWHFFVGNLPPSSKPRAQPLLPLHRLHRRVFSHLIL